MSESVPNRPFRKHEFDHGEPNKRAKESESSIDAPQIDHLETKYVLRFSFSFGCCHPQ